MTLIQPRFAPVPVQVVAWRDVPVDVSVVGPIALKTMPRIRQVFIESNSGLTGDELERELFIVRKLMEKEKVGPRGLAWEAQSRGDCSAMTCHGHAASPWVALRRAEEQVLADAAARWQQARVSACTRAPLPAPLAALPASHLLPTVRPPPPPPLLQAASLGEDHWDFYACTLSNRTIVYKGMLNSAAGGWRRAHQRGTAGQTPLGGRWVLHDSRASHAAAAHACLPTCTAPPPHAAQWAPSSRT